MISYEDGCAALDWLAKAFGFRERTRLADDDGRLMHGEMDVGGGLIMLASPTPDYEAPRRHRESCERARKWSTVPWIVDGVLVHVEDVDAHFAREGGGRNNPFRHRRRATRPQVSGRRPGRASLVLYPARAR